MRQSFDTEVSLLFYSGAQIFKSLKKVGVRLYHIFIMIEWPERNLGHFPVNLPWKVFCYLDHFQMVAFQLLLQEFMENFETLKSS